MADNTGTPPAPADAGGNWLTPGRFAAVLGLLLFAAFPEVFLLQGTFFHRDYGCFSYPLAWVHRESFWHGELPLWNPHNYCGLPLLAQWNSMTLYPGALIYLLLPLPWSLGFFCLAHLFLGGLGMFWLARRWTGHAWAAALAGLAYPFTALLLHSLMWPGNIAALGWMPWVVLLVERASREGWRWLPGAALAGAMQMLAGAPEIIAQTWALNGLLFAGQFFRGGENRLRLLARFAAAAALVAALSAVQLLPFLDLLAHSQRDQNYGGSVWAMPWWGWANLFVPLFRTMPAALGVHAQPGQFWIGSYYPGVIVMLLAALGLWRTRERRVLLLGVATVLALWLALGDDGWLYGAVRRIFPGIGVMRYPVKFTVTAAFCLPLLAAFGARGVLEPGGPRRPELAWLGIVAGIVAALSILGARFPVDGVSGALAAWNGLGKIALLALAAGAILWWRRAGNPPARRWAASVLALLLWADAMSNGARANPTVSAWVYEPGLARRELRLQPEPEAGRSRVMAQFNAELALNALPLPDPVEAFLYLRLGQSSNFNLLDGIPKITGLFPLHFREFEYVISLLYMPTNPPPPLLDFLGVTHLTAPGKSLAWEPRAGAQPWITAGQRPVFAEVGEAYAALSATNFAPREVVYLAPEARELARAASRTEARVTPLHFSAHRVEFEVEADKPALAVISQNYYHNWRATVDGRPAPLLRANLAFQAVAVPAGRSRVVLVYRERTLAAGAALSGLALLGTLAALWKNRKAAVPPPA